MDYLDFEVEIDIVEESKGVYPVRAHSSSAGEARGTMRFPFDKQALEKQLLALQYVLLHSSGKPPPPPNASAGRAIGAGQANGRTLRAGIVQRALY